MTLSLSVPINSTVQSSTLVYTNSATYQRVPVLVLSYSLLGLNYCLSVYKDLMWNVPMAEYHIQFKLAPILHDFSLFCQNLVAVS